MTLETYNVECGRTCPSLGSPSLDTLHMNLGITTEIGEIMDVIKRKIAYKKDYDLVNIAEEIGDLAWYVSNRYRMSTLQKELKPVPTPHKFYDIEQLADYILGLEIKHESYTTLTSVNMGIAQFFGLDFEECLQKNIDKLYARYPEKFTESLAINRDVENERKVLEK